VSAGSAGSKPVCWGNPTGSPVINRYTACLDALPNASADDPARGFDAAPTIAI